MIARAAARFSGVVATGPPSWKISSTTVSRLRICTSGMDEAFFSRKNRWRSELQGITDDPSLSLQVKRGCADQALREKGSRKLFAGRKRCVHFLVSQRANTLGHEALA